MYSEEWMCTDSADQGGILEPLHLLPTLVCGSVRWSELKWHFKFAELHISDRDIDLRDLHSRRSQAHPQSASFKAPPFCTFSDLYSFSWIPMERPHMINYPRKTAYLVYSLLQETGGLASC